MCENEAQAGDSNNESDRKQIEDDSAAPAACERQEKVELIFTRYDTDGDGVLRHADVARLEKEVADEEIDDESWAALCELVGAADVGVGWGVEELGRLYSMEGGEQELEKAWCFVTSTMETQGIDVRVGSHGELGNETSADSNAQNGM